MGWRYGNGGGKRKGDCERGEEKEEEGRYRRRILKTR